LIYLDLLNYDDEILMQMKKHKLKSVDEVKDECVFTRYSYASSYVSVRMSVSPYVTDVLWLNGAKYGQSC